MATPPQFETDKPKLLDLFCGAGGAGMGYHHAGFEVVGIDIALQKRYPFQFIQADALAYAREHGALFDVIHASPPCQFASELYNPVKGRDLKHINLIPATRTIVQALNKPYVIENVKGARKHLQNPLKLHGSMFNLPLFRPRYFEIVPCPNVLLPVPREDFTPVVVNGSSTRHSLTSEMRSAMQIDWMTKMELRQAIPPAYTQWIGEQLLKALGHD